MSSRASAIELLDRADCERLLAGTRLGRLATTSNALPVIFPVEYAMLDGDPVFRTASGSKLRTAASGNVVCLEVDDIDPIEHLGWSVLVTGRSSVITEPAELARARALPLRPWLDDSDAFVRVEASMVSGRRLGRADPLDGVDGVATHTPVLHSC